jgi:hypothetical protein
MRRTLSFVCLAIALCAAGAVGQQSQKPLTNADVLAMVKNHMAESVVIAAIQSSPTNFNTSASELIRLKKLGVTDNEMNAMIAASGRGTTGKPLPAGDSGAEQSAVAMQPAKSRMPRVLVSEGNSIHELRLEKTQLAETKSKPTSMKTLAADSAVTQGLQTAVNTVAMDAAMHTNSAIGGSMVGQAGSIFSGMMSHRKASVTYVWGVPGPASANALQTVSPSFTVDFSRVPTVNADDYEPAIVKLTPAQNTCRIVGATQGKEDARSTPAADWQVYSHFLEDRVNTKNEKLGAGKYKVSPTSELFPGEYAVVLRPISKDKKFSGGDVARAQGDGLMFDAIWTFQISDNVE